MDEVTKRRIASGITSRGYLDSLSVSASLKESIPSPVVWRVCSTTRGNSKADVTTMMNGRRRNVP
jgi:hypothetical protein